MQNSDINISELIKKIEANEFDHIDFFVLSNLVKIVHQLGLKKGEVLKLKIEDVVDESGGVVKPINIGKREMSVSPEVEAIIESQIDHLNNADDYNVDRNSPLFQDKKGSKYSEAARQLRDKFNSPTMEKIRQSGLRKFYDSLKNLNDKDRMDEMKKFTGLSDKEIKGIVDENIQEGGEKKAVYEKDSYMDEVIDRLKKEKDIDYSEFGAIIDKLNEFDLDDMSKVERLKNAYFHAVDINVSLNKDAEGVDETKKANSKRIIKEWLLDRFCDAGIVFDPATNKAKRAPKRKGGKEDRVSMSLFEAITGKIPENRSYKTRTDKNHKESKAIEIQADKENLKRKMDQTFKIDINTLLNNCSLEPIKSYATHLLNILIDRLPAEISDKKLPENDKGIHQESFRILIEGKIINISSQSTEKPFSNYYEMANYLAKDGHVCRPTKNLNNDQIYLIERDILLKIISITWNIFTKTERINFYLGLLENDNLEMMMQYFPFNSYWANKPFNYTLLKKLFGSNSTAFLKIAGLIVNSTFFYYFNKDIPIKINKTHKIWRDSFRGKIIKTINKFSYAKAQMAMLGCISCISLLRQIEFFKDKGISFENTKAFEINPSRIFFDY